MFLRNGVAHRLCGGRILDLARLAAAEHVAVRVTRLRAEHVEAPWLGQPMIGRGHRGGEQLLHLLARDLAAGESLDRAARRNRIRYIHRLFVHSCVHLTCMRSTCWTTRLLLLAFCRMVTLFRSFQQPISSVCR